ncbi:type III restriction-modification system endonuclease [Virgibacillus alimentarius]|uniref:Type III restriction enzyme n=1 Tax=Virgibacillus alimentarius TaxID=698769 RepID=A0ABS4S7M2_9BACI|nr:DEAD/DEAH box helicase family protein [Virgibacillus alimentarius]MBP2257490.1 type III restriction enzyme [Virgibacillus alimentarius]
MKIKFDKQQYQIDAVNSIVDIFKGQSVKVSNFSVGAGHILGQQQTELGIGNKLELSEQEVLENIQKIQVQNHLKKSAAIQDWNFTVEMETGTGKTYVYTRSIFELNKKYGFSKFVIVVPSVAIREGVYKSFQMTADHFNELYPGQYCHYFIYDSSKLERVREYATSNNIEVMIMNIDAFKKNENLINQERDTMNGKRPIEFIQETNPIVIIDEPQSVDNTDKAKEAIASLNPLCKLRYSATHRETYNLMYKLDPVDAYEKRLVKKIEVLSVNSDDDYNDPYIKLINVANKSGYKATIELDEKKKNGTVNRVRKQIDPNKKNNLFLLSGERDLYHGYVLAGIDCYPGNESIEFENGRVLGLGDVIGGMDGDLLKRYQIRETIRTHLDKELKLVYKGIKVLSLFFIDKVANYRAYNDDGTWGHGKYAQMFEEEYMSLVKLPKYQTLFKEDSYLTNFDVSEVHGGYFSQDKKGRFKDSRTTKDGSLRSNKDDESFFELIMKKKEELLSFETPLRFIFSHSALKEGWDNPNVFQICTLVETKDTFTKRQKIGRGLRLPVNNEGRRVYDENDNILTVVANESYEEFADSLQKEMEEETGVKFGYITQQVFAPITYKDENDKEQTLGYEKSEKMFKYLLEKNYIDKKGKVKESLKQDLANEKFNVPEEFKSIKEDVERVIKKSIKKLPVFNGKDKINIGLNKEVLLGDEFKQLWDKIKFKTTYSVDLDSEKLINESVSEIKKLDPFRSRKVKRENALLKVEQSGVTGEGRTMRVYEALEEERRLPDILRYLQEQTNLKRRTLVDILIKSERLKDFKKNPQAFMEAVMKIINREKRKLIIDGIKYERIGDHEYYEQSLFENEELVGYMKANAVQVDNAKSVYNYIKYDSETEKAFAEKLNNDEDVKLFIKLPGSFVIDTPLGNYNPDWAILIEKDGVEKLFFVIETKGSTDQEDLRLREDGKITCGRKHFAALENGVKYDVANSYEQLKENV